MARKLVSFDQNGEPWFDNPSLVLANRPRRKKRTRKYRANYGAAGSFSSRISASEAKDLRSMMSDYSGHGSDEGSTGYRSRTRRKARKKGKTRMASRKQMAARRRFSAMAKFRAKRGLKRKRRYTGVFLAKSKGMKRRAGGRLSFRVNKRRSRRYRHNPPAMMSKGLSLFGFQLPPLDAVLYVGSGLIVPPMVAAQIAKYIPDSIKSTLGTAGPWLIKVASVLLPGYALRRFVSPRAGNLYMIGGAASLVIEAIKTFMPGVIPGIGSQAMLGYYVGGSLGAYDTRVQNGQVRSFRPAQNRQSPMLSEVPDRLDPAGRF